MLQHGDVVCFQAMDGHRFGAVSRDDLGLVVDNGGIMTVLWDTVDADPVTPTGWLDSGRWGLARRTRHTLTPSEVDTFVRSWWGRLYEREK